VTWLESSAAVCIRQVAYGAAHVVGGLVQDEQVGAPQQRRREREPPPLAAAEARHRRVGVGQADGLQQAARLAGGVGVGRARVGKVGLWLAVRTPCRTPPGRQEQPLGAQAPPAAAPPAAAPYPGRWARPPRRPPPTPASRPCARSRAAARASRRRRRPQGPSHTPGGLGGVGVGVGPGHESILWTCGAPQRLKGPAAPPGAARTCHPAASRPPHLHRARRVIVAGQHSLQHRHAARRAGTSAATTAAAAARPLAAGRRRGVVLFIRRQQHVRLSAGAGWVGCGAG
jgi:hypothetical protein